MHPSVFVVTGASQGLGAAIACLAAVRLAMRARHDWSGEILEWDDEKVQVLEGYG